MKSKLEQDGRHIREREESGREYAKGVCKVSMQSGMQSEYAK